MKVYRNVDSIRQRVGTTFGLELEVLSAAGYEWQVSDCPHMLESLGSKFTTSGQTVGGESVQLLKFKPKKAGEGLLRLICKRPWDAQPSKSLSINISVSE